jgi:O-acetylhomoserine (thiol)-lyase
LESSPFNAAAKKYTPNGVGGIVSFEIKGGRAAGERFVSALQLHKHVANFGDVRSLVVHPASTTHSQLTEEEQLSAGVEPGLVRLSVGLESLDDILADLELGFAASK